jgi:hypothetical protein
MSRGGAAWSAALGPEESGTGSVDEGQRGGCSAGSGHRGGGGATRAPATGVWLRQRGCVQAPAARAKGHELRPLRRARRGRRCYLKGAAQELEPPSWGIFVKRTQTASVSFCEKGV